MKKTMIVLVALSGLALAEETTTIKPLEQDGWTLTSNRNAGASNQAKQNKAEGTIYANDPWWKRPEATYDFSDVLSLTQQGESIAFSFDMTLSLIQPYNSICTVALEGASGSTAKTIMMGYGAGYSAANNTNFKSAVVENNSSRVYLFDTDPGDGNDWKSAYNCTTADKLATLPVKEGTAKVNFATTFSGLIEWNDESNAFVLELHQTYGAETFNKTYVLGDTYTMSGISILMDGNSTDGDKDIFTISNMTITRTLPEPATATLSLLALAGLAARRRRH